MENEESKILRDATDDIQVAFEKLRFYGERVGRLEKRVYELERSQRSAIYCGDRTRAFQKFLTIQGLDPGPIDGRFGPITWQATLKFLGSIDPDFFFGGVRGAKI